MGKFLGNHSVAVRALFLVLSAFVLAGCVSTARPDGKDGREAVRAVGELKAELDEFGRRIAIIEGKSSTVRSDVELFELEFREYVELVRTMRRRLEQYEALVEGREKEELY